MRLCEGKFGPWCEPQIKLLLLMCKVFLCNGLAFQLEVHFEIPGVKLMNISGLTNLISKKLNYKFGRNIRNPEYICAIK